MSAPPDPYAILTGPHEASCRFYLSDCLDLLRQLPATSVDVIVTSPPYNIGVRYRSYNDALSSDEYLGWTRRWIAEAARVLKSDGSLFLNVGARPSDPWTALDVAQAIREQLHLQNVIHWIKSIAIERQSAGSTAGLAKDLAVGHYKPINSPRYLNDCHEFIFHFTPAGTTRLERLALGVPYQDQSNIGRWRAASEGIRCRGNTWFIPYETIQRRDRDRPHPATFPSRLPEQCLRLHGLSRIGTAMDPFTGLGSTAVACARLGVNFLGSEMDEGYLKQAVKRVQEAIGTPTLPARGHAAMKKAAMRKTSLRRPSARATA